MDGDRRAGERIAILGNLTGEVMVYQPMTITEIGVGCASVEATYPLHLDSLHDLRLTLGNQSIVLKGRVVQSHVTDMDQEAVIYRSGLEFVEASERVTGVIANYITELKTHRSGA